MCDGGGGGGGGGRRDVSSSSVIYENRKFVNYMHSYICMFIHSFIHII